MAEEHDKQDSKPGNLTEAIREALPQIDAALAEGDMSLTERVLQAAIFIVEHMIVDVRVGDKIDDKKDYALKPWFVFIYQDVAEWYRESYGAALDRNESGRAHGFVLIRGLPVELIVPLTRSRVETPGETAWLSFPKEVEANENPLNWLNEPPNVATLDDPSRTRLLQAANEIGTALRSIRVNGMGIEPPDEVAEGLLEGVLAEFEAAAKNALRKDAAGRSAALWNIHMAVERTLKAFNQHKTGSFRQIHNLFELFDDIAGHGITADRDLLKKLRRDSAVIEDRYGLGNPSSTQEVFASYRAGLLLTSSLMKSFKRKYNVGGASFLLKQPPWVKRRKQNVQANS